MNQAIQHNDTRQWSFTEMALNGAKSFGILSNGDVTILKTKIQNLSHEETSILLTNNSRISKTSVTFEEYIDGELLRQKLEQQN